jgi:hypothetical protein
MTTGTALLIGSPVTPAIPLHLSSLTFQGGGAIPVLKFDVVERLYIRYILARRCGAHQQTVSTVGLLQWSQTF